MLQWIVVLFVSFFGIYYFYNKIKSSNLKETQLKLVKDDQLLESKQQEIEQNIKDIKKTIINVDKIEENKTEQEVLNYWNKK